MAQGFEIAPGAGPVVHPAPTGDPDPPAWHATTSEPPITAPVDAQTAPQSAPGASAGGPPHGDSAPRQTPEQPPVPGGRPELAVLTDCGEQRRRMRVLVEQAPHVTIVYALRDGTIRYANAAAALLLGWRPDQLLGANIFEVLAVPENGASDPTDPDPDEPSLLPGEYPARLADGSIRFLDVRSAPVIFEGVRCSQVVAWDVTPRVERERELIRRASYDELTGLPNATHAFVYLEQSLRRLERSGTGCVAVILIDLDGFKAVNDTYGHQAGDTLLQHTATRIRTTTRDTDMAARLHGDEFLVVQNVANPMHAAYVSDRLRTVLARPIDIEGITVKVSASVGVAVAEPGTKDPQHLLQFADHRMYTDKQRRAQTRDSSGR